MATYKNRRIKSQRLKEDNFSLIGLQSIENYHPQQPEFSLSNLQESHDTAQQLSAKLVVAEAYLNALRDEVMNAEWRFHELMLGCKKSVRAQFGSESNEIQLVGLKKKSRYKSRTKRVRVKACGIPPQEQEAVD
jgi:hypothetical protein